MPNMMSLSPLRQPWAAAVLVLFLIWTVWLTAGFTDFPHELVGSKPAKRPGPPHAADRPLILYAYSESPSAHDNLEFFIDHGLHSAADFVFILNGETQVHKLLPNETNIRYIKRPNECYDLGAHGEVLQSPLPSNPDLPLYKGYKRFILMNASIRGPFLPYWAETCWSEMYLGKLTEEVKLVGMTANCWPQFHVQSMIWALDLVGIELLLFPPQPIPTIENPEPKPLLGINSCFHGWDEAVNAEVHGAEVITTGGYKVDVMMTLYHSISDYAEQCDPTIPNDVLWNGNYAGTNIHPYETIFLKANRNIDPILMDRLTDWTNGRNYTSYDMCL